MSELVLRYIVSFFPDWGGDEAASSQDRQEWLKWLTGGGEGSCSQSARLISLDYLGNFTLRIGNRVPRTTRIVHL